MHNTLYLECRSGISGDMAVASLLDLGADEGYLKDTLAKLPLCGYRTEINHIVKNGLKVCDFDVILERPHPHEHKADHIHEDARPHKHRTWGEIEAMLKQADLEPRVLELALEMFETIARAEGKVHGCSREAVHFHEVGAVDSIVDIVGTAACLDNLEIGRVVISELSEGCGFAECQHGVLPVPVPAVLEIAALNNMVINQTDTKGEMITPTGAAIAALSKGEMPHKFKILRVGMGAGKRNYSAANIVRAMLIEEY